MIRVALAEDHHLVRQGIRLLLEQANDIEIVAEAENGQEAINITVDLKPDILIMDINMPRLNGIQAAEQIKEMNISTKVIILSMHSDETLVRQALQNGVQGYLLKRSVMEELLIAIRAAIRGEYYLCPSVSQLVMTEFLAGQAAPKVQDPFDLLTAREREVLKLVAEGYTNKAIAQTMHLSIKTIEKHRSSLMSKLDVTDLAGLIRVALKHGLIFFDE